MRRPLLLTTALAVAGLALGCASASPHPAAPAPAAPAAEPDPAAQPDPADPDARAPFVTLLRDGALWTVIPGDAPRDTGLRPGPECSDTQGIGSSSPVVSPDGRHVAFNAGELVVAPLDPPGPPEAITAHRGGDDVCVQITGWSADSRRLLFHVGESPLDDADPVPELTTGFYLWERGAGPPRHLPHLDSADALTPDGRAVLQAVHQPGPPVGRALRRVSLDDGAAATPLAARDDAYAFGQLHVAGDRVAFIARTTIELAPVDDLDAATVIARGDFADLQWPRLSPDGQRLAWQRAARDGATLVARTLGADGAGEDVTLGPLAGGARVEVEWFDASRLLVCDAGGVSLVALDGASTPVAGAGACFVPRCAR